ncbi:cysteine--tRNA ligase [Microbacterium sp. ANT_H45B]|uniref:cysteine--tRNA ligase n=1 Tax=Microbacterium TaxID=33882 RepID=UPI0011F02F21|nr:MULTISPECIES: cysteine--tRNA ligase [Microbacterium]KAA0962853.1 cysteine--tRNA ligase [Microbacterium sp. ANT_H45B]MCP1430764.1 cysteinyl-tRNA synthetase [Microbacterium foliorum]
MTLRLYDTRAQQLRDFVPLDSENITMYVCGPTVQSGPHIGHVRAALSFDLLRRWLAHRYGRVTFVRNVTDIDDKVLANATGAEPWWALAYRMEQEFTAAYAGVGILAPTYEPRATASIPQMQELIATLIERGHAYPAPDGSGDVYFDVRSWPSYGELTNQSVDAMEAAEDADPRGKRNPQDFALWKGAKADEQADATWQSPWGAGRPGWHIECSAMSKRYLGPEFDIHGGGLDLRFPHHENELAQSTAAGDGFAQYWVHNGLVTVGGQKMSKSLGNFTLAAEVLDAHDPLVVRYALAAAHYRSSLDLTESSWTEAEAALGRIRTFLDRGQRLAKPGWSQAKEGLPTEFWDAMNDDLAVPRALAAIHSSIRSGNALLDDGKIDEARQDVMDVIAMTNILGLNPHASAWSESGDGATASALDALVQTMITQRAQARADKDWAAADRIRDAIAAAGITLEDSPAGTHWSIDG